MATTDENNDYATITDLSNFWRQIEDNEETKATTLIHYASVYLRRVAKNNDVDLDAQLESDTDGTFHDVLTMVVVEAVKRAMATPTDAPPADSWSQSANPYSESMHLVNPSSNLYFKANELALIGLSSVSGRSKIGILRGARGSEC